jgi:hypothetical protein
LFDLKLFLIKPLTIKYFPRPHGAVRYQIWVAMDEVHCEKEEDKICFGVYFCFKNHDKNHPKENFPPYINLQNHLISSKSDYRTKPN